MVQAMHLYPYFVQDPVFEDSKIAASRVHLGNVGENTSPYTEGMISVWIEGEAYNLQNVCSEVGLNNRGFAASLLAAYKTGKLEKYLNKLDAYFCAAIYDAEQGALKLITDRYGMRLLYWYHKNGLFAWASEVKGILALKGVDQTIDKTSLPCFMDLGFLVGEHTWFENIKLVNPATIISANLKTNTVQHKHYWSWSEIQTFDLTFDDAVEEMGNRFLDSVSKRFDPNEKIGVALSGGLDSRAIVAAVNHLFPGYKGYSYTFGIPGCDDIKIAEEVMARCGWRHQSFYFTENNWFEPRIKKVWHTDGMKDMKDMHGCEFLDDIKKEMIINLNGYAGDAIMGGAFLNKVPLNKRASNKNVLSFYKNHIGLIDVESRFYNIKKVEPVLYMNRVRRFTNMGTVNALASIDQRKPFFDNNLVELVFSLPDEYRAYNIIYSTMLLRFFPKFYSDIPWQRTGKPVAVLKQKIKSRNLFYRGVRKIQRMAGLQKKKKPVSTYTNYNAWVRSPLVSKALRELLDSKNAFYPKHTDENIYEKYLLPHLQDPAVNHSVKILRAATFELYMNRQS